MNFNQLTFRIALVGVLFLWSCGGGAGVNPTGLMGEQIQCPTGPRPALDCRGVLQQYARDFKLDLDAMEKVKVSLGVTTAKLTEADALTSDLLQHSYQTCTLYNACIIPPQEYAAKSEKLQDVQLQVRRALVGGGGYAAQQQNIQINPVPGVPGQQFPPQFPGGAPSFPGGAPPQPFPGGVPSQPFPGGGAPPQGVPYSGAPPPPYPQTGSAYGMPDPGFSQQPGMPQSAPYAGQPGQYGNPAPNPAGLQSVDAILNALRDGSQTFRGISTTPTQPGSSATQASTPPAQDLDTLLKSMLLSLKQDVTARNPALASARVVVGNFTEENRPWSGPMGALLQDRVSAVAMNDGIFSQSTGVQMRGITVKEAGAVSNANDPKALTALYNTDLAITGTYQTQSDGVHVKLAALQNAAEIAEVSKTIPPGAIPDVVAATPQNAADTNQLINSLNQIGPKADGKLNFTTNRPGPGSSFRLGEEIIFFVTSVNDGYLYLFHVDGDKNVTRIFPNQYQQDARIRAGQTLQVPAAGAPFKFEASPPFGLETTFAIVSQTPFSDADLQAIQNGFGGPKQEAPAFLKTRGINVVQSGAAPSAAAAPVLWNSVTVLVRP